MRITLLTLCLFICSRINAQTVNSKTELKDYQVFVGAAYLTTGVAATFHGIYSTQTDKERENTYYKEARNATMFISGVLLVTAINSYSSHRRKEKGLSMIVHPTGFNLAYKF